MASSTPPNDADALRREMAQIRRDLRRDVREVVEQAEAVADWRRYLGMYPWLTVGVSFAVGYLIVPKRWRSVPLEPALQASIREAVASVPTEAKDQEKPRPNLLSTAWATVAPVAIRLAQGYAVQYLENWLMRQNEAAVFRVPPHPPPRASNPTSGPGPSRTRGPGAA